MNATRPHSRVRQRTLLRETRILPKRSYTLDAPLPMVFSDIASMSQNDLGELVVGHIARRRLTGTPRIKTAGRNIRHAAPPHEPARWFDVLSRIRTLRWGSNRYRERSGRGFSQNLTLELELAVLPRSFESPSRSAVVEPSLRMPASMKAYLTEL
jgi:hypothetical protein